ncbi:GH14939 [Drosophila grimshawi]|uniref:Odorant receptor n=1 Tax=Drosophila grimshawi TaxID=7222 RepID=B4J1M1_DROGR|nr:GH14939 [Drosophila grimshawi]
MAASASSQFSKIIGLVRKCTNVCGCDVWNPDYHTWAMTYFTITLVVFMYTSNGYTIYVELVYNNDWTVILRVFSIAGSTMQAQAKIQSTLEYETSLRELMVTYDLMYKEYEAKGGAYIKCLQKRVKNTWRMLIAFMLLYLIVAISMAVYPIYLYVVHNEKTLVMQFLVPGINHNTDRGHEILTVLHVIALGMGAFGHFGCDMFLFINIANLPLLTDLFKVKINEFNELVVQSNKNEQIRDMFWELLAWHQKYSGILRKTEKVYNLIFFVQLSTSCINILCTISCIFLKVWPTAMLFLIYSVIVLYTYCGLGTQIEHSNDDCVTIIYTECRWYDLPISEQHFLLLMLRMSQTTSSLSVAGMMPLNVNTALQLTKAAYSMGMMLMTNED